MTRCDHEFDKEIRKVEKLSKVGAAFTPSRTPKNGEFNRQRRLSNCSSAASSGDNIEMINSWAEKYKNKDESTNSLFTQKIFEIL